MKKTSFPIFMKAILTGTLLLLICFRPAAQSITNYSFTSSNGTFTALTGGNTTTWTGNTDDAVSGLIPIGFDFWYMGVRYTNISASTNGWFTLGTVITDYLYTNSLTSGGAPRPVIAPLWDDLDIAANSNVTYKTTGAAGNQVFTIQYLNVKWNYQALGSVCSFQVKLYENTGKVEFIYRSDLLSPNSASASIGITAAATGSGNFLSVNNNGNNVSSTSESNITSKRATGKIYDFVPPVPTAPLSLTFSGIGNTAMTLNWSDQSSNERGFAIYRSTDGINYTFVSQAAANATSSLQTGLSENTTYHWKVYAVSEGALSSALSGNQATFCTPPAAPIVTSPINYCLNATAAQLTAAGTNLWWGGTSIAGSVGGTTALTTSTYVDNQWADNNKKTNFTTTTSNVTITAVDYYIPAWQAVNGLVLAIFNNSGTVVATSSTTTTQTAGASPVAITNIFNYTIASPGNYSIGVVSGSGVIGSDNPGFPITEASGTINITGVSAAGVRCYNNIRFATGSPTAPVPSTAIAGTSNYQVTQTINGCTSLPATITVNVTAPNISQIPAANLIAHYPFSGNANDATVNNNGALQNAPALTTDRFGNSNKAYSFNGSTQYISTSNAYVNPTDFTISIWFKTSSATGGRLIGFGREQTGSSGQYDRHIYMNNAGQVYFGIYSGTVKTASSVASYNDNNWHLATATLSSTTGMVLYIDGVQAGSNPATAAEDYTGYWKIGYDNMNGWTSQPSNFYFTGSLDDALIYHRVLTGAEVAVLYNSPDGAGNSGPVCIGSTVNLSATTLPGATYAWSGPNGYSSNQQNPSFTYTAAHAGIYTLQVTAGGCIATAYTNVTSTANAGQWTGNVSTDWADGSNWCTGIVPDATTNVIILSTATRMPSINSSATCNSLTINTGASLIITASGTLNIAGMLANSGSITNSGTVNFNGTSGQQTFSGLTSFYNLTVSNTSGLLLPAAVTVNNNLTVSAGTLNANNFNIVVKGSWTNNASAAAFTAGTSTVTFNGAIAQTIGGSFATTFNNLTIANTAGGVALGSNINISDNLSVSAGVFNLAGFTADRTSAGGTLTVSNNATLKIGGTNTYPANYATNTLVVASTVEYAGTNQTVANQLYGNLLLSSSTGVAVKTLPSTALTIEGSLSSTLGTGTSVSFTAASNITVNGNVSIGASTTFNGGSFSHNIRGNWINDGSFVGNASTITFTGAGTSVSGAGSQGFHHLTVAASPISFSTGTISLTGNLLTTGAGSFSQVSGGTLSMTGTGTSIGGAGISLDNLTVSGTVSTASTLALTGNLSISGSFTASAGVITMSGTSKTIAGAGSKTFNVLSVTGSVTTDAAFSISSGLSVNGSLQATAGTVTFTGTSTLSGTANLFNTAINGTSLQLSSNSVLGIAGTLTVTAGVLNVTSSIPNTVNFNGNGSQDINAITYCNLVLSGGGTKTALNNIVTTYDLTISSGTTFTLSSYTLSIYGSWNNNGTFTPATSTVEFAGPATAYINGATTFNILTSNTSNSTTELILRDNVTADIVNMTNGVISTEEDTLTITNTRTGNGKIFGNIRRTHSFSTGVAYAFKNPENTINFSSVSGVTSITVTVLQGQVSDFPFGGSINEEYKIAVPAGSYTAALSLNYEDAFLNGNNESSMTLWRHNGSSWTAIGKATNNTTLNYVTQNGLTNITGRWTLSDELNHIRWNGSVSTDWNTAANWTAIGGAPSAPPSASDIVDLGTAAFTNQPTISSNASAKNIHFGSAQAVTLTLASGGSLIVAGNIDGEWNTNRTHTIQVNNQTVSVAGNIIMSDGTNGHRIDLAIGSGTLTIASLIQSGDAQVNFSGAGILNILDHFDYTGGTFNAGTGTVVYSGDGNQRIAHVNYNNFTVNKISGIATNDSVTNIGGNLLVAAGQLDNLSTINIAGNVDINSGATIYDSYMLHVGGNWTNNGNYTGTGAHIKFNGTGTQTISASTFNNIEVIKPIGSSVILAGDLVVNGDMNVVSGTFNLKTFICARSVQGGTITLGNSATAILGANNPPVNFSSYSLADSSTVIFDGVDEQIIAAADISFGNIVLRNTGIKKLAGLLTVNGNLTIENGSTFNADSNTINLKGNWTDNGTFIPSTGTVSFTGASKTISGNTTFNIVTVTGSYTILHNVTFNELLNITSTGSLSGGSSIHVTMHGDLINSGVLYTLGTTTYSGNRVQTLRLVNAVTTVALTVNFNGTVSPVLNSTSAPQFGYLNINNTGGVNPSVGWTVLYSLTIGNGASFNGGISTHNLLGNVTNNGTITSSGRLNFIPSATATVNLGNNLSSTGTVVFGGAGAMTLTGIPDSLTDVIISNTNAAGITPPSGWTVARNLTINSGAIFNAGNYSYQVGGNLLSNGTLNSGGSTFTLNGAEPQDISTQSAFTNLTVSKPGSATLLTNVTVNGTLHFISGKIKTGSNVLILSSSGTVTGTAQNTGWVAGKLQKNIATGPTTRLFEVGDSVNYTPVQVAFSNVTTAGNLTAFTTTYDHPQISSSTINESKSVNRYWTLINSGILFTSYNATFNFVETDMDAGITPSAVVAGRYNDGSWTYPTIGTVTSTSVEAIGLTAFIDFQIGEMIIFVKTWDGGAGTSNWGDAANWNTDGVPTANDDVELTRADIININVPATAKSILLNNPALVLTTEAGRSLTVAEDFTLVAGTFNTAAAFPTVSGTIDVSGGTVGFTGSIAQTIPAYQYNNLTSSSTGSRTLANSGTIGITGTFTPGTNTYTVAGSTVDFNNAGQQAIASFNYHNLLLSNAGEKIFGSGTTGIAGTLSITGSATTNATANASTISYNGSANQTATAIIYYNLDAANAAGVTLPDLTINNNLSVSTGAASIGNDATARIISVNGDISVASGAALNVAGNSNTTHLLIASGNITNNGTLNLRPDANSLCNVVFNKNGNQAIAGTGATTSFNLVTVNQGTSSSNYVDVTAANFSAPDGFLTLNNGSFNLNSPAAIVTPFTADITTGNFLIPATAGLWASAGTIQSANMNWTVAGLVKVAGGTFNMGNVADNAVIPKSTAIFSVTAGNLNLASRISNPAATWTLLMKGGTVTVNTQGSSAAGIAPFNMDAAGCQFDMSGGTIIIQQVGGSAGQHFSYTNLATAGPGFTGGTLQLGNASTPAAQNMEIISTRPVHNLAVNNSNTTALLETTDLTVSNDVIITAGSLDINNKLLRIGGSVSNNGTFSANEGTVEFNGSAAQTIPASTFAGNLVRNLIINNTAGVTLGGTLNIADILLAAAGQFNTGGYLTLLSTAEQTALIDGSGAGEVLGNVTMQRYLESGFGYKYFSSPFQASTVAEFGDDLDLNASFPSFYRYEEDVPSSGWVKYTNPSGTLNPFAGYAANFGSSSASKTVDLTGVVNNQTITAPLLYNHNRPYTQGFHLVGNPYPSPIDWDAASGWTRTNIDNAVYYFTNSTTNQYTGVYSSYINGISSDGVAGNIIPSMQGFFIHVSDGSFPAPAELSINNAARTTDLSPVYYGSSTGRVLRLSAGFNDDEPVSDAAVIYFDSRARKTFDQRYDALKMMNTNPAVPNLYAVSADSAKISIRAMAYPSDSVTMQPLGLKTEKDGWVTFNALQMPDLAGLPYIYLWDAKANVYHDLKQAPRYRINLPAGDYQGRFFIVFKKQQATTTTTPVVTETFTTSVTSGTLTIRSKLSSTEKGRLMVSNMLGQILYNQEVNGTNSYTVPANLANGIYVVSLQSAQGVYSKKIFIGR